MRGRRRPDTDATTEFLEGLAARRHEPLLERVSGTLRLELTNGKRIEWLVTMRKGDLTVSRAKSEADCVARAQKKVFDGIVKGKVNAMAAVLRGSLTVEGDPELLVVFQRLFPGPSQRRS